MAPSVRMWPCCHSARPDPASTICLAGFCIRCGLRLDAPQNWRRARMNRAEKLRAEIRRRDGPDCFLCLEPFSDGDVQTLDHVVPRSRGGSNRIANLTLTHEGCNQLKADRLGVARGAFARVGLTG